MKRILTALAVVIALIAPVGALVPTAAPADALRLQASRPRPSVAIVVRPARVAPGARFVVTATIRHAVRGQRVVLQKRVGKRWVVMATKRSRAGRSSVRFGARFTARGRHPLRVRLMARGRARAATSRVVAVTVMPRTVTGGGGTGTPIDTATGSFRAVYAVASDEVPDPAHPAAIAGVVAAVDTWFASQTTPSVRPRWVRDVGGSVHVDTVVLPRTTAELASTSEGGLFGTAAAAAGLAPHEKLVVFIDLPTAVNACGVTASDVSLIPEQSCSITPSADPFPYGASYLVAHEMTHNFGAVPSCAPHSDGTGHVNDDPRDVLYAGAKARDWSHITLDPGHDDYYRTSGSCPDIADSGFWEPAA